MGAQKTWAWIIGIIFLLVGIWGFFTTDILGIFHVGMAHNVIHIVLGLIFIWGAWKGPAKPINTWLGVIYLLVAVLGFLGLLTFLDIMGGNDPDNWLHLVIGLVSALIGWKAS